VEQQQEAYMNSTNTLQQRNIYTISDSGFGVGNTDGGRNIGL
jgi:hypothetical protein